MLTRAEFSSDADALLTHVEACWRDACAGRAMPRRVDISPSKLGRALPFVALLDVIPGPPLDFRYRLMGQHVIVNAGQNLTGKRCLELPQVSPTGRPVFEAYCKCVATRALVSMDVDLRTLNDTKRRMRAAILPLSEDGVTPNALLSAALFLD